MPYIQQSAKHSTGHEAVVADLSAAHSSCETPFTLHPKGALVLVTGFEPNIWLRQSNNF